MPKKTRLIPRAVHSNAARVPALLNSLPEIRNIAPGVAFFIYEGADGLFTPAYLGPDDWLYFIIADKTNESIGLSALRDPEPGFRVCGFLASNLEKVMADLIQMCGLPWGGSK